MKILYIIDYYSPHIGGVETLFQHLIEGVVLKGHQAIILTTHHDKNLPIFEKLSESIEIHRVGSNRYDFMMYAFLKGREIVPQVDIIHTSTYNSALPSFFLSYFSKKKCIITVHEIFAGLWFDFLGWKGIFYWLFERFIGNLRFSHYITVSEYTKKNLLLHFDIDTSKVDTVYNGIDYDFWKVGKYKEQDVQNIKNELFLSDKYTGTYFGRPGISKGLEYYLKAIPSVLKTIPNFYTILIVPDSDKKRFSYIKNLIRDLDIGTNIHLIPGIEKEKLALYILASNFVIVPSLAEGFGFSAAETCSLGKNLIVSDTASLPEVVSGKIIFVEAGNIKSITEGIIKSYKGEYQHIPEKIFSWDSTIEKTLKIYTSLLS